MFIAALFIIVKIWKQPKCPAVDEWIKQPWGIYTMEFYFAIKKKKNLPFATIWTDIENITLSEISQPEKDIWFHSYVESNEQTELTSELETDSQMESKMTAGVGGEVGGWKDQA